MYDQILEVLMEKRLNVQLSKAASFTGKSDIVFAGVVRKKSKSLLMHSYRVCCVSYMSCAHCGRASSSVRLCVGAVVP